jgi:hypothetical protein
MNASSKFEVFNPGIAEETEVFARLVNGGQNDKD